MVTKCKVVDVPAGTPIPDVLEEATRLFGKGHIVDHDGNVVETSAPKLQGGQYIWRVRTVQPGASGRSTKAWNDLMYAGHGCGRISLLQPLLIMHTL